MYVWVDDEVTPGQDRKGGRGPEKGGADWRGCREVPRGFIEGACLASMPCTVCRCVTLVLQPGAEVADSTGQHANLLVAKRAQHTAHASKLCKREDC